MAARMTNNLYQFLSNEDLVTRNLGKFLLHYKTGGCTQIQLECYNNFITLQFSAEIGPHQLGHKIPSVRPRQPRRRVPRPPPGFEDRHPATPPPPPPKQNKVILDLGTRPRPTFNTVGRDLSNVNILLDVSPRVVASVHLKQLDGIST